MGRRGDVGRGGGSTHYSASLSSTNHLEGEGGDTRKRCFSRREQQRRKQTHEVRGIGRESSRVTRPCIEIAAFTPLRREQRHKPAMSKHDMHIDVCAHHLWDTGEMEAVRGTGAAGREKKGRCHFHIWKWQTSTQGAVEMPTCHNTIAQQRRQVQTAAPRSWLVCCVRT